MKKYFSILIAALLFIGVFTPISAFAASTYYYSVEGTSSIKPGIYKGIVNGTGKAVKTENVYKFKNITKKPPFKLGGTYNYYGKGSLAKKSDFKGDYQYSLMTKPIQKVQTKGKDLYYTKFLARTAYLGSFCGGGVTDLLEIYKRNSKGKITKLVTDKVSANIENQIVVKGNYIYYAKVKKSAFRDFDIVRATLDGKKKTTLKKSVDNFWISGNKIYYVKSSALYRMDLNGKNAKKYSKLKIKLYTSNGCEPGNYSVTSKGLFVSEENAIYLDFSTGKTTTIKELIYPNNILDVNVKKKQFVELYYDYDKFKYTSIKVHNFSGKVIKTVKLTVSGKGSIISADAAKGEVIYISGKKLKKIKL